ncbi:unnamed protein product [Sphagnum troendelagicum]|uniref:Uncharacterized protein n=1 Tax=Sphagnum troendelagicum TaxID=128251 RepID=A0ABP0TAT2_9BRYO
MQRPNDPKSPLKDARDCKYAAQIDEVRDEALHTTLCFLHALQKPLRRNLRGKVLKGVSLYLRNRARLRWLAFSDLRFRSEKSEAMFCIVRQQTHSGFVAQELTRTEDEE